MTKRPVLFKDCNVMKIFLTLHGLGTPSRDVDAGERPFWIDVDRFRRIVALARGHANAVRLTFDDGNVSDVEIALPALLEAGLKASFFFSTDFIGRPGFADEDDIRKLAAAGMEIGSHGSRHVSWRDMSGDEIAEDVIRSFARLETILDKRISVVAPPFGECNLHVVQILRKLGIKRVYSGFPGPSRAGDWLVRRMAVTAAAPWPRVESWLTEPHTWFGWAAKSAAAARTVGHAVFWDAPKRP